MTLRRFWVALVIVTAVIYAGNVIANWVASEVCIGTALVTDANGSTEVGDAGCSRHLDPRP